ncbi:hypothetical protein [Jiangella asiatica]|uniref:Uncharacterized protein n=1 Tax=Jiangella asiatica TaxID=2530372 RepID=A0A4R5DI01_9ACTN|nr:hypothetical protein [Jiangella asiatica]TDE13509.1 hypothetical protein E1269_05620 [Jiangella asiatica]
MVTVPNSEHRDVIVRAPFLGDEVGHMVARHDAEGPTIDVRLAPQDTEQHVEFSISPAEARELAEQLVRIADAAQRAGWTPDVLAQVRERFLPGHTDQQIIERLDRLAERLGGFVLGHHGRVSWRAGRILTAELGAEAVGRAALALEAAVEQLSAVGAAVGPLTELRAALTQLDVFYRAESEHRP